MRTTLFTALALGTALSPLGAQVQQKVTILSNDTLVTIERGDKLSCAVKVGDRTLSESAAKPICDRKQDNVVFFGDVDGQMLRLNDLRDKLQTMHFPTESLMRLNREQLDLARKLQAQSLALTKEGSALALRSRVAPSVTFGNVWSNVGEDRGYIGVTIDPRPRDTDRWGAYVQAVTPNYPADKAGLKAGDVIMSIDGQSLTKGPTSRTATDDESFAWIRLSEIVGKLEPGKTVDLTYRRDGKEQKTRITPVADTRWMVATTEPGGAISRFFSEPTRVPGVMVAPRAPDAPEVTTWGLGPEGRAFSAFSNGNGGSFAFTFGGALADLELAPMNPGLGEYFGTSRGVLVVDAPDNGGLGLKPGDVVTAVDGRSVDTPGELIRVLRTYDNDKQFTMTITRKKQQQAISTTMGSADKR